MRVIESASGASRREVALEALAGITSGALLVANERGAADELAHESTRRAGARFGLHRFSLPQLVSHLATERLAESELAPATSLGIEAIAARVAFEAAQAGEIPRLERVRAFPGFARALARTLNEVRLAALTPDRLRAAERPAAREVGALLGRYETALADARVADRAAVLATARTELDAARHAELVTGPLIGLDLAVRSRHEAVFVVELARRASSAVVTIPRGDRRTLALLADASGGALESEPAPTGKDAKALRHVRENLFREDREGVEGADDGVDIFSAPGETRECVEIARQVLAAARDGVPFDEIAIFLRTPESYTQLLETAFSRAGVLATFARGTQRPDPSGRAFLSLLACAAERLSARRFSEYLSFSQVPALRDGRPPADRTIWTPSRDESASRGAARVVQLSLFDVPPPDEAPVPVTGETAGPGAGREGSEDASAEVASTGEDPLVAPWKWESYLVEASVIQGRDRWAKRLRGYRNELEIKREAYRREDPDGPRVAVIARECENVDKLQRFALPVIQALDELPARAAWGEWLRALRALAPMVLKSPERVLSVLGELDPMAEVGPVEISEVREVLAERLSTLEKDPELPRHGRVFVATPEHARGRSFRVVFVPGVAERVFPQRPREDPLLLDVDRTALDEVLARLDDRTAEERLLLRLAVGAARERLVLSYPRVDVLDARPRVPSFYAFDVKAATIGRIPSLEDFEREAHGAARARLAWPAPEDPAHAIDVVEHDLSVLGALIQNAGDHAKTAGRARYLLGQNAHLARSLRWVFVRERRKSWRPADGIVRATEHTKPVLERFRPAVRAYSATALQRYAACPYKFLLSAIHRLEPRPEPAPLIRMDPLTRGRMFHTVQARTLSALREEELLPVTHRNLPRALHALERAIETEEQRFRDELEPAIKRVWDDEVERLAADLRVWLQRMASESGIWKPTNFELAFGLPLETGGEPRDPASSPSPVSIAGGFRLRGAVDLVEASTERDALRVTDHKTGADRTRPGMIAGGGETLQPLLYALAVENLLSKRVTDSRLYFATSRGGYRDRVVPMDERARLYAREVFEIIDRAVSEGALPPAPTRETGSGRIACDWCDFLPICGTREHVRTRGKDRSLLRDLDEIRRMP